MRHGNKGLVVEQYKIFGTCNLDQYIYFFLIPCTHSPPVFYELMTSLRGIVQLKMYMSTYLVAYSLLKVVESYITLIVITHPALFHVFVFSYQPPGWLSINFSFQCSSIIAKYSFTDQTHCHLSLPPWAKLGALYDLTDFPYEEKIGPDSQLMKFISL